MLILTIRTDKPDAEIGLFNNTKKLEYKIWSAHRQLAETLNTEIKQLLSLRELFLLQEQFSQNRLDGIICYQGPGSFTGLRIGLSVGNALAYGLEIPIVGQTGEEWIKNGINRLLSGENEKTVLPRYGSPVHITKPKK